jgi:hypothetical protein
LFIYLVVGYNNHFVRFFSIAVLCIPWFHLTYDNKDIKLLKLGYFTIVKQKSKLETPTKLEHHKLHEMFAWSTMEWLDIYVHLSKIWEQLEMWILQRLLSHQSSHEFITNRYYLHQHTRSEFFI